MIDLRLRRTRLDWPLAALRIALQDPQSPSGLGMLGVRARAGRQEHVQHSINLTDIGGAGHRRERKEGSDEGRPRHRGRIVVERESSFLLFTFSSLSCLNRPPASREALALSQYPCLVWRALLFRCFQS